MWYMQRTLVPTQQLLSNFSNNKLTGCFLFNITADIDSCCNAKRTAGIHRSASIADVTWDKYTQLCTVAVHSLTSIHIK